MELTTQEIEAIVEEATTQVIGNRQTITPDEMEQVILLIARILSQRHNPAQN